MARFRLTPPMFPKLTENDVERACLDLLKAKNLLPIRLHSGLFPMPDKLCEDCRARVRWIRVGEPGIPDYCIPRFFLEVKRPGGRPSPEQLAKIAELAQGWNLETAVVDDVQTLLDWLNLHKP